MIQVIPALQDVSAFWMFCFEDSEPISVNKSVSILMINSLITEKLSLVS